MNIGDSKGCWDVMFSLPDPVPLNHGIIPPPPPHSPESRCINWEGPTSLHLLPVAGNLWNSVYSSLHVTYCRLIYDSKHIGVNFLWYVSLLNEFLRMYIWSVPRCKLSLFSPETTPDTILSMRTAGVRLKAVCKAGLSVNWHILAFVSSLNNSKLIWRSF